MCCVLLAPCIRFTDYSYSSSISLFPCRGFSPSVHRGRPAVESAPGVARSGALAAASRRGSGPVAGAAVRQSPPRCSPSCALSPAAFHRPRSWAVRGGRGGSCWRRQCRSVTHAGGRSTRAARRSIRCDAAPVARSVCPWRAQPDPWRALAPGAFRARECRYSHPERQWPQRRVRRCTQRNTGVTGGARAR